MFERAGVIAGPMPKTPGSPESASRTQLVLLQVLVTIVLCYQLLFSRDGLLTTEAQQAVTLGLLIGLAGIILLPDRIWSAGWFVAALVLVDTTVTSAIIYWSGNAASDLFLIYFLIILIAACTPTFTQMLALSAVLYLAYGVILYVGALETGEIVEGQLLRLPVLLILTTFYGLAADTVRTMHRQKAGLIDDIGALKRAEEENAKLIAELQEALVKIKTLRGLLPICAWCKKIRDDQGYWNQIESYVHAHTEAEFTHGLCPDCGTKMLQDYQKHR